MSCDSPVTQEQGPANPPTIPAAQVGTRLLGQNERPEPLPDAVTDTHLALTRGIAEYLSQQSREGTGGRVLRFVKTFEQWAAPEMRAEYPSVGVYAQERGRYDASQLTPSIEHEFDKDSQEQRRVLVKRAEFVQQLLVDVWAKDNGERTALMLLCEEALSPTLFMFGCRLYLPHYYGQAAIIEPVGMGYVEEPDAQLRNERRSVLLVEARVDAMALVSLPVGRLQVAGTVSTLPLPGPEPRFLEVRKAG
jgi:hypothetical protein